MDKLKGSILLARLAFLDSRYSPDQREQVFSALSDDERAILDGKILPGSWYPRDLHLHLITAIDNILGQGDYRLIRTMGYFAAGHQLSGAYRSFVRSDDPTFLLSRAASIWQLFNTFGHMEFESAGPRRCKLRIFDLGSPDLVTVEGIIGWVQKGLELSGCQEIKFRYDPINSPNQDAYRILISWTD